MRFDPARVLDLGARLDPDRPAFSPALTRATDRVAAELAQAGCEVQLVPRPVRLDAPAVVALAAALLLGVVAGAPHFPWSQSNAGRWSVPAGMLAITLVVFAGRLARQASRARLEPPRHLVAVTRSAGARPARLVVVVMSHTRSPASDSGYLAAVLTVGLLASLALRSLGSSRAWSDGLILETLWLAILGLAYFRLLTPYDGVRSDPTGLAFLSELARTVPRGVRDRVDVWFVATPSPRDLARRYRASWGDGQPTAVVRIEAPGCGRIDVKGWGVAAALANDAATSLRLPFRWSAPRRRPLDPFARLGIPSVELVSRRDQAPEPALLRGFESLVWEIALRFGRSATRRFS